MKKVQAIVKQYWAHPFMKGSAVVFGGTMIVNVLAYLYHLVVGRILGPVGYGELAALISIFYILNAPSVVVQNILVKFFSQLKAKEEYGQAKRLLIRISRILLFVQIALLILLVPFVGKIAAFLHITDHINLLWLYVMFAMFLFSIVNLSVLQAFQKFVPMTVINIFGGVLRLGFGAIGAFFSVAWALFANVMATLVMYAATFFPLGGLLKRKESSLSMSPAKALYFAIPACIAVFSVTAIYSQDVILVKHFFDAQEAGIYSSLSVLGKIIFFASYALGIVAFPMLAERKELGKSYGTIFFLALLAAGAISVGITIVYFLFPSFVVGALFGSGFAAASVYLGLFGVFISLFTLSYLLTTMYLALGNTGVWVLTTMAAVLQTIIIWVNHTSLSTVIINNTIIAGGLFITLLLYYPRVRR